MDRVRDQGMNRDGANTIPTGATEVYEGARISLDPFRPLVREAKPRRLNGEYTQYVRSFTLGLAGGPTGSITIYQREPFMNRDKRSRDDDQSRQEMLRKLLELLRGDDTRRVLTITVEPRHAGDWPADYGSVHEAIFKDPCVKFKFLGLREGSNKNSLSLRLFAFRKSPTFEKPCACDKSALVTIKAEAMNPAPAETVQASLDLKRA